MEIARGSKAECRAYSSKDETRAPDAGFGFIELGRYEDVPDKRGQGARNDIHAATELIRAGGTLQSVAQEHGEAYVKFHRGFLAFQSAIHSGPRVRDAGGVFQPPRVFWFYGSTGTGKTLAVFEASGAEEVFSKPGGNDWWDGYCGQPVVLLDDYRGNWFPLLTFFDFLIDIPFRYHSKAATCRSIPLLFISPVLCALRFFMLVWKLVLRVLLRSYCVVLLRYVCLVMNLLLLVLW